MRRQNFLILIIILILIINILIIYNQTCQIKDLTYLIDIKTDDVIWLDQRVEFLEGQVYNHNFKLDEFDRGYQTHLNEFDKLINVLIDGGFIYQTTCD